MTPFCRRPFIFPLLVSLAVLCAKTGAARLDEHLDGMDAAEEPPSIVSTATGNQVPWKLLSWSDFPVDDVRPGLSAETVTYLRFRYQTALRSEIAQDGTKRYVATVKEITFLCGFDKTQSWRRSQVKNNMALLHHEQGHLDLNEIKRRQLQDTPLSSLPVGQGAGMAEANADLSQQLGEWYRSELFKLRTEQVQYDEETHFGASPKRQTDWTKRIAKNLSAPYGPSPTQIAGTSVPIAPVTGVGTPPVSPATTTGIH